MSTTGEPATEIDLGGVPFDDDFEVEEVVTRGGPAHDTAASLQQRGIGYPAHTPAGTRELIRYTMARWPGGSDRGALTNPPRSIRNGSTPSMHNWGVAWDWRWEPGPGRAAAEAVIDFFTSNATALNVQAVHDYVSGRYWKNNAGWRTADLSKGAKTGFGQSWAQWLHIERTWAAANDPAPIAQLLSGAGPAAPIVHSLTNKPDQGPAAVPPASAIPATEMKVGSEGADVAVLQDYLRFTGFASFTISDGKFGNKTGEAVKAAQQKFKDIGIYTTLVDGRWGPKSRAAGDEYLRRGGR